MNRRERTLARALARAHTRAVELHDALDRALGRAFDLDFDRDLVRYRAHVLAHNLGRACVRASDLDRDLRNTLADVFNLSYAFDLDFDRDRALRFDRDLVRELDVARDLACAIQLDLASAVRANSARVPAGDVAVKPSAAPGGLAVLAGQLAAAAVRLLPAGDRRRYLEEFQSELADLALARGNRRAQLAYAVRLLISAWRLRAELRSPRRRRAVL